MPDLSKIQFQALINDQEPMPVENIVFTGEHKELDPETAVYILMSELTPVLVIKNSVAEISFKFEDGDCYFKPEHLPDEAMVSLKQLWATVQGSYDSRALGEEMQLCVAREVGEYIQRNSTLTLTVDGSTLGGGYISALLVVNNGTVRYFECEIDQKQFDGEDLYELFNLPEECSD